MLFVKEFAEVCRQLPQQNAVNTHLNPSILLTQISIQVCPSIHNSFDVFDLHEWKCYVRPRMKTHDFTGTLCCSTLKQGVITDFCLKVTNHHNIFAVLLSYGLQTDLQEFPRALQLKRSK